MREVQGRYIHTNRCAEPHELLLYSYVRVQFQKYVRSLPSFMLEQDLLKVKNPYTISLHSYLNDSDIFLSAQL